MPKTYWRNPKIKIDKRGLTEKQAVIVDNVLEIGPDAAVRLAHPGASERSVKSMVSRELKRPIVAAAISDLLNKRGATREACASNLAARMRAEDAMPSLKATEIILKLHGELKDSPTTNIAMFTPEVLDNLIEARRQRNRSQLPG